jgi:hypothetical protein
MDEGFEAWARENPPEYPFGADPARCAKLYAERAWQASRRAAMEEACAAVHAGDWEIGTRYTCAPQEEVPSISKTADNIEAAIRRAFAEEDSAAIRQMAEEGGGGAE